MWSTATEEIYSSTCSFCISEKINALLFMILNRDISWNNTKFCVCTITNPHGLRHVMLCCSGFNSGTEFVRISPASLTSNTFTSCPCTR
jgi:hypothetical protein